jgi:hypothetical protein
MTQYVKGMSQFESLAIVPKPFVGAETLNNGELSVVTDTPGIRLYVRENGTLKPAIEFEEKLDRTASALHIVVDPVKGVTPESGIIVKSQEEVDLLGSVRLIQEAIDILPGKIWHDVTIRLVGGFHLASVGNLENSDQSNACFVFNREISNNAKISFEGETAVVAMSGVTEGFTIAIQDVNLTVNTLQGKVLAIHTGSGAGRRCVIESNSSNTITLVDYCFKSPENILFNVESNTSTILSSTDGKVCNAVGPITYISVTFKNVSFGTAAQPMADMGWSYGSTPIKFVECACLLARDNTSLGSFPAEFLRSFIQFDSGTFDTYARIENCLILGRIISIADHLYLASSTISTEGLWAIISTGGNLIFDGSKEKSCIKLIGGSNSSLDIIGPGSLRCVNHGNLSLLFSNSKVAITTNNSILNLGSTVLNCEPGHEFIIDETAHACSEIESLGDIIEGKYGSIMGRI